MIQIIKHFFILISLLVAFACGVYVKSELTPSDAVVNVDLILSQYPKMVAARQQNEIKMNELMQWINNVNQEIAAETDPVKQEKLTDQYRKLAQEKEMLIRQEYSNRVQEVDIELTALIDRVAKQNGCGSVFSSISMVTGGKDITENVLKELR